jgi:phage-related protein
VIYVAKFEESIYVLHAFEKKSRKTKRGEIDLARQRLRQVVRDRARRKAGPGTGWTT